MGKLTKIITELSLETQNNEQTCETAYKEIMKRKNVGMQINIFVLETEILGAQ